MDIHKPLTLLGALTPAAFMRDYWQKKPLLVRQAIPNFEALVARDTLFEMATSEDVESRLISHDAKAGWAFKYGPFTRKALPSLKKSEWTLLIQGVDTHLDAAHQLLQQFRFVPQARLDDLMISFATDGGGVGPHFDSYDVFLLQAQGQRRWRIGETKDATLRPNVPVKILQNFDYDEEHILNPGDMLYLPPRYAHDGVAIGECMTYSVGFRSSDQAELARELLQRLADDADELVGDVIYQDPSQAAVQAAGAIPKSLQKFAEQAIKAVLKDPQALAHALGTYLSEPKQNVWFEEGTKPRKLQHIVLDRRTRMMYDAQHIFINGEGYCAAGADAVLMQRLADQGFLTAEDLQDISTSARSLLLSWCESGWIHNKK